MSENQELKEIDIIKLITDFHAFNKTTDEINQEYPDLITKNEISYSATNNFIWNGVEYSSKLLSVGKRLLTILMLPNNVTIEETDSIIKNLKNYLSDNFEFKCNNKKTLWQIDDCLLNICRERSGNGYQIVICKGKID